MPTTVACSQHSVNIKLLRHKLNPKRWPGLWEIRLVGDGARTRSKPPAHTRWGMPARLWEERILQLSSFCVFHHSMSPMRQLHPTFPMGKGRTQVSLQAPGGDNTNSIIRKNIGSKQQPQQAMPVCSGNRIGHGSTSPTVAVALCLFWCHQAGKLWRFPQHPWSQQPKWGQRHQLQHTRSKSSTPPSGFMCLSANEWPSTERSPIASRCSGHRSQA